MSNLPHAAQIVPATRIVAITAGPTAFAETRGIFINASGSFDLTFADGSTDTLTLVGGQVYPFGIIKCTSGTGLRALY
jgi:hypothetical protein